MGGKINKQLVFTCDSRETWVRKPVLPPFLLSFFFFKGTFYSNMDFSSSVMPLVVATINNSFDIYRKVTGEIFGACRSTEVATVHHSWVRCCYSFPGAATQVSVQIYVYLYIYIYNYIYVYTCQAPRITFSPTKGKHLAGMPTTATSLHRITFPCAQSWLSPAPFGFSSSL